MAAKFSRVRESRRTTTNASGLRRGFAAVALTAGIAGFAALGMAGLVSSPAGAAPGNNGTVKIAGVGDVDNVPNNAPHQGCTFTIQWWGFDADETASVSFALQAPTPGSLTVSGDLSPHINGGQGGSVLDHVEAYTLTPGAGVVPQAQQGYHVKVTVTTPHSKGNDTKSKVFWFSGCSVPTSTPPVPCVTQTVTETVTETVTAAPVVPRKQARAVVAADPCAVTATVTQTATVTTTPVNNPCVTQTVTATVTATVDPRVAVDPTCQVTVTDTATATNGIPNGGSPTIPNQTGGGNPESVYTPSVKPTAVTSPQPGQVVPTRIESGLATLPISAGTQQHTDRWPLFALSGLSALLGGIGLLPRRRTSRRS